MFQPPRKKLHAAPNNAAAATDNNNHITHTNAPSSDTPGNPPPRKAACASCYRDRTGCHPFIRPCPRCVRLSHECTERTRKKYGSGRLANVVPAIPISMSYNVSPMVMAAGNGSQVSNGQIVSAAFAAPVPASAMNSHPHAMHNHMEQSNGARADMGVQYYTSPSMAISHHSFHSMPQVNQQHQEQRYISSVQSQPRTLQSYPQLNQQYSYTHQQAHPHIHSHSHTHVHPHQMSAQARPPTLPILPQTQQQQQQPRQQPVHHANQVINPQVIPVVNPLSPKLLPSDNYDEHEIPSKQMGMNSNGIAIPAANPTLAIDTNAPVEGQPRFVSPAHMTSPRFNADLMDDWKRWMSDSEFPNDAAFPFDQQAPAFANADFPVRSESPFLTSDESSADDFLRAIDEFDVLPHTLPTLQQGQSDSNAAMTSATTQHLTAKAQVKIEEGTIPKAPMTSSSSAINALRYIQSRVSGGQMTLYRARVLVAALMWSVDNQQQEDLIQAFNNVSVNESNGQNPSDSDNSAAFAERNREQTDIKKSANAIVIQLIRMQDAHRALHQNSQPVNTTSNRSSISVDGGAAAPAAGPRSSNVPSSSASTVSSASSTSSHSSDWTPGQFTNQFKTSPEKCIADTDGVARLILSYETIAPTANAVHRSAAEIKEMSRFVATANKTIQAITSQERKRHRPAKRRFMSQEEEEETWIAIQEQAVKAKLATTEVNSPGSESVRSSPSPSIGTAAPVVTHTGANGKITVSTGSSIVDSICVVVNESYERLAGHSQKEVKQLCCDYGRSGFWRIIRDDYRTALYQALLEMQLMGPDCPYRTLFARVVVDRRTSATVAHVGITPTLFPDGTPKSFVVEFYPLDIPVHDINPNVTIMPNDVVLSSTFETQSAQHQ